MYKDKKMLGVITARGGSKGLPGKNIKELCGKPLIAWTIEQAKNSKYLDKTIVSTDSEEIAEISIKYGGDVPFLRPKELALDTTPSIDVLFHALDFLRNQGENYDYLALLEPTNPLRKKDDIDNAIKQLIDNKEIASSIIGIGKTIHQHPSYLFNLDENKILIPLGANDINTYLLRQKIKNDYYFPNALIYVSEITALEQNKSFYHDRTIGYITERWQNYEIDDIYDFLCVEAIMKFKLNEIL